MNIRYHISLILLVLGSYITGCSQKERDAHPVDVPAAVRVKSDTVLPLQYHIRMFSDPAVIRSFLDSLDEVSVQLLLKINRRDRDHLYPNKRIVIPSVFTDSLLASYPHELNSIRHIPKIIFVDRRLQTFGCYASGRLLRWGPVSTGKKTTPTPDGLYYTNWKSRLTRSTVDSEWIMPWYINIENDLGISMHQYSLPGYPASHSCVRLLEDDAIWLYQWIDQWKLSPDRKTIAQYGTPVIIFGMYDYAPKIPLWIKSPETKVSQSQIDSVCSLYAQTIRDRKRAED